MSYCQDDGEALLKLMAQFGESSSEFNGADIRRKVPTVPEFSGSKAIPSTEICLYQRLSTK